MQMPLLLRETYSAVSLSISISVVAAASATVMGRDTAICLFGGALKWPKWRRVIRKPTLLRLAGALGELERPEIIDRITA